MVRLIPPGTVAAVRRCNLYPSQMLPPLVDPEGSETAGLWRIWWRSVRDVRVRYGVVT